MCIQNTLQQKIAEITNDGETIVRYLAGTLQSESYAIKPCHKLDAARMLTKYGFAQPEGKVIPFNSVRPEPVEGQTTQTPTNHQSTTPN